MSWPWMGAWGVFCVLLFHWRAFGPQSHAQFFDSADGAQILMAYHRQGITGWASTIQWWHGPFMHQNAFYRPLASYLYWFDLRTYVVNGALPSELLTFGLFSGWIFAGAMLVQQFTKLKWAPLAWCIVGASFRMDFLSNGRPDWLQWWPVQDSLLALVLWAIALSAFLSWIESSRGWSLVIALVSGVLALFAKESAYVIAIQWAATVYFMGHGGREWKPVIALAFVTAAVCVARHGFLPPSAISSTLTGSIIEHSTWIFWGRQLWAFPEWRSPLQLVLFASSNWAQLIAGVIPAAVPLMALRFLKKRGTATAPIYCTAASAIISTFSQMGDIPWGRSAMMPQLLTVCTICQLIADKLGSTPLSAKSAHLPDPKEIPKADSDRG